MPPDTVRELLARARRKLDDRGIDTAGLDARLLLQHVAGLTHETIVSDPDATVDAKAVVAFDALVERRLTHEPVSRIIGAREFYGRPFHVTPAVLDPRPDTETLIDFALSILPANARMLDLGTGSGIIAVTLLAERPDAHAVATDISRDALAVAQGNAEALGVADRLMLLHGNWYQPLSGEFDLIVSNPPYIPLAAIEGLAPEVRNFDPVRALDGGPDGLEAFRRMAEGAARHLKPHGHVLAEIGFGQAEAVASIFSSCGFRQTGRRNDLAGHVRCLAFRQL